MSVRNARLMSFVSRQILAAASPANFLHTNPDLLEQTRAESGQNLVRGFRNWFEDLERMLRRSRPVSAERFEIGKQVAVTPGKVVFRNRLIELIQYSAQTRSVYAEPILIVPASPPTPWLPISTGCITGSTALFSKPGVVLCSTSILRRAWPI